MKTINVVRNRDNIVELKSDLSSLGADFVLTEEEARASWREMPRPVLALNCVGGASATELCKSLAKDGVHVTYGGMSMRPVLASTSHLIFKVDCILCLTVCLRSLVHFIFVVIGQKVKRNNGMM